MRLNAAPWLPVPRSHVARFKSSGLPRWQQRAGFNNLVCRLRHVRLFLCQFSHHSACRHESLDVIVRREVLQPLHMESTCYLPSPDSICVSTEKKAGREDYICGHVHDENAHFLGGISGNAGLFSSLDDVITFAKMLSSHAKGYLSEALFDLATSDLTPYDEESRGLGFHLFRAGTFPGGSLMSRGSYGHTGYTGTTLYVDRETDIYCLLLTNRVHYGRDGMHYFSHRRAFFDLVYDDIRRGGI
jgi:CubicO group peptidase (beta-lactamase class C family)